MTIDSVRVNEVAQEIIFRSVMCGVEGTEESALHSDVDLKKSSTVEQA